ncbi:MAG: AAA family ATPase [Candidatus Latescibacteria bacterium]|nr:AAA family ATPase [Candidatus Latescibacterota bacterium]
MLTRLKVSNFKNLVDVDLYLGPFTCVVGPNGVGKSNLFDAIRFLSALANHTLMEAAAAVRDQDSRTAHVRDLFHRVGDHYAERITFEAEMIVPRRAIDDLGQEAEASITSLRYSLELAYRETDDSLVRGALAIVKEELVPIAQRDASQHLLFPHSAKDWRKSAVCGKRHAPFISTADEGENRVIKLHQDGGSSGRPLPRSADNLPRTVLSIANAAESPTVLVARREMESWQMLQLEPSALRRPDEFVSPTHLGADGRYLAATLYRLARHDGQQVRGAIYSQIANRLAELIDDVNDIDIERDEKRELLTLYIKNGEGTQHPARALSDGTLRFLALAVLEIDPQMQGVLCLEEPENGIHPARIPAILQLLSDIAVDTQKPIGEDNPLRQVIVNTHSPVVFQQVPDESVVFVKAKEAKDREGRLCKKAHFLCLSDTWRANVSEDAVRGDLLAYLNPVIPKKYAEAARKKRVVDREDMQQLLLSPSW